MKPKSIDEILITLYLGKLEPEITTKEFITKQFEKGSKLAEAKAQIQQLLEECAPEKKDDEPLKDNSDDEFYEALGFNQSIDQYKSNIRGKLK